MEYSDKAKVPTGSSCLPNGQQKFEGIDCGVLPDTSTERVGVPSMSSSNAVLGPNSETPASHSEKASKAKSNKSGRRGKKTSDIKGSSRYPLRSALKSQTNIGHKSTPPVPPPPESIARDKKKKKRRKLKKDFSDEYLCIRNRVRYLFGKMNYEQSLIEAYAGEGWNGQSSEKVRPEKEIERAKSAIISFKLKIRDQFQRLDSLISEGKHDEGLFDTEGQLDSEDIFCAKCGSKDLSVNNDIILCDGICDRGFHQKCLNPPLHSDDIPSGDEGWLCPGCDCKVDCIDLLNEVEGTDLAIEDTWENVFPEAACAAARNNMYDDYLGLPSEDSEDEDFAPDDNKNDVEVSSSEDSGYTSEESEMPTHLAPDGNLGLPSDDSEDDDFDPNKPESDVELFDDGSNNSDFTSDSEGSGALENLISDAEKSLPPPTSDESQFTLPSSDETSTKPPKKSSLKTELLSLMEDAGLDDSMLGSGKRALRRLDYKKLYDEAYGDNSSDSSDDENWTTNKAKKSENVTNVKVPSSRKRSYTQDKGNLKCNKGTYTQKEPSQLLISGHEWSSVLQKAQQTSEENQDPRRDKKQILAEELGLSPQQVDRWFNNSGNRVQTTIASQPESRSRKRIPTCTSLKGVPIEGKSSQKLKHGATGKGDKGAVPKKRKNKNTVVAEKPTDDGGKCEPVAIQAGVVGNGSSKIVSKRAASTTHRQIGTKGIKKKKTEER